MPTTLSGVVIFVALLVPGLLYHVQRSARVPQRALSPLLETATLATVSLGTNVVTVGVFAALRTWALREHSPDPTRVLEKGSAYIIPNVGYIAAWGFGFVVVSCAIAVLLGTLHDRLASSVGFLAPLIVDVSAWYRVFERGPEGSAVYVGCDMRDGSYVAGVLAWYSTEVDETADRDVVLAPPLLSKRNGTVETVDGFARLIISARDVSRFYVSFLKPEALEPNATRSA
jgi:hypothetical protein